MKREARGAELRRERVLFAAEAIVRQGVRSGRVMVGIYDSCSKVE